MSSPLATPAKRPSGIRAYATLVVALAAFLASMVVLRVPFRGYLIEGRLSGRLGDGLDRPAVEAWLTSAAPGVHVRVDAGEGGRCEVVLQQVAPRAGETQIAIDRVTRQFAEQFVTQRREASRQARLSRLQAEVQSARDTEDAIRASLDQDRPEQWVHAPRAAHPETPPVPSAEPVSPAPLAAVPLAVGDARLKALHERLEALKVELAGLLGNLTEEHPRVITLRSQIAGLERELAAPDSGIARGTRPDKPASYETQTGDAEGVVDAQANLAAATRARQWAERQLQAEVERLSSAAGYPWSIEPARVLARVGGTPRALTLFAAALITLVAALVMYFASATLIPRLMIQTADEIADVLAMPLIATTQVSPRAGPPKRRLAPWTVKFAVHGAEIILAAMFLALAFTMLSDRWLAGQVIADPFGVLSEVAGRLLG
jgi:hypothetical protein